MASEKVKAAQRRAGGLRKSDQAAGSGTIYPEDTKSPTDLQARRLCRLYAVSYDMALTVASLAYAAGCPR